MKKKAREDVAKAKRMEEYLRMFKYVGDNYRKDTAKPSFQIGLEEEAMLSVANEVSKRLRLGQQKGNSLFRWTHRMGLGQDRSLQSGADDIFEAELYRLLEVAAEKATGSANNLGVELVGRLPSNISQEFLKEFQTQGNQIIQNSSSSSELIEMPQLRAGKIDITGYNSGSYTVETNIQPQWKEFIELFTNVKLSLKNYSSNTVYTTIHLGKTDPAKAILASLNSLGYKEKEAVHIYYHLIGEKETFLNNNENGHHIIHLRFAYELSGAGLYDAKNERIDAVDFLVYNDPVSGNVWVRSTKAMIAEMTKYSNDFGDPLYSDIVILKNSFN